MSDNEILERCRRGDKAAFNLLFTRYGKFIENVARRILRDSEAVQDAAQEVMFRMLEGIGTFQGKCRLTTWIYRITLNECCRYIEKFRNNRTRPLTEMDEAVSEEVCSLRRVMDEEQKETVQRLLGEIEPDYRRVLELHYYMGMGVSDIAVNLGLPQGTVASRISRGRESMRARMDSSMAICA